MDKECRLSIKNNSLDKIKAIANQTRLDILKYLDNNPSSINEISKALKLPFTTIATNIDILAKADLINFCYHGGKHGLLKICSLKYESLTFVMHDDLENNSISSEKFSIPIGSYSSFNIKAPCGIVSKNCFIGKDDDVSSFYSPERFNAELIWFTSGYVEYKIPIKQNKKIIGVSVEFEFCSEAPGYRLNYPSDIAVSINGVNLGIITSPSDFGGKRGQYTPKWWPIASTQYGQLGKWEVDNRGCIVGNCMKDDITIKDLNIHDLITLRIISDENAKNNGGINIFGKEFGNFQTNIEIIINYE